MPVRQGMQQVQTGPKRLDGQRALRVDLVQGAGKFVEQIGVDRRTVPALGPGREPGLRFAQGSPAL
eukprot:13422-Eustigmatos_ZCMA.PRE.1